MELNMKAIIYCRVSSKVQEKDGVSLGVQESSCREYCLKNGYSVYKVIREIASAKNMQKQHKLHDVLEEEENKILVVFAVSRFSRNVVQGIEFAKKLSDKRVSLRSVTEPLNTGSPMEQHSFVTMLNAAELESKLISQRVIKSLQVRIYSQLNKLTLIVSEEVGC